MFSQVFFDQNPNGLIGSSNTSGKVVPGPSAIRSFLEPQRDLKGLAPVSGSLLIPALLFIGLLFSVQLHAATDISREVSRGRSEFSSFLELGIDLSYAKLPVVGLSASEDDAADDYASIALLIDGGISWRGFFAEAVYSSFGGVALGYSLYQNENMAIDVLASNIFGEIEADQAGFESIETRDEDVQAGIRSTFYIGNSIFQVSLLSDISDTHDGQSASLHWGYSHQVRNWNLNAIAGVRYFSADLNDHYFGVSQSEAINGLAVHEADSGLLGELEFGGTRPLNENWLLRAYAGAFKLSDGLTDSPLILDDMAYDAGVSFIYVVR